MAEARAGDRSIDPEELLRSALEKIVFFECRVEQLEAELAAARAAEERARGDAAAARREATDAARALASERGVRAEAEACATDSAERVRLLEAERERFLSGLQDRARVGAAPGADGGAPEEGGADLAGFIAELRAEIERLRAWKAAAEARGIGDGSTRAPAAPPTRAVEPVVRLAERLRGEGRVGLTPADAGRLRDALATGSDRTLFERSLDQLGSTDPSRRLRAARALEALGAKAAAPVLAAALGREEDAEVRAGLLGILARLREPVVADLARRALGDAEPAVRVAALEALAAVAGGASDDDLAAALDDASPFVRRRAAILLGFSRAPRADESLARALSDRDAGVARAAAAALSGRPSAFAQGALARALDHADASVRRAASTALARWSGDVVDGDAPAHERRRAGRRIAEKLAAMGGAQIREAVLGVVLRRDDHPPGHLPLSPAGRERVMPGHLPLSPTGGEGQGEGAAPRYATPTATPTAPLTPTLSPRRAGGEGLTSGNHPLSPTGGEGRMPGEGAIPEELESSVLGEVRTALRGRTDDELASALRAPGPRVEAALHALAARGAVVRRGPRWFTS